MGGATFLEYYSYSTRKNLEKMPAVMSAKIKLNDCSEHVSTIFGNFRKTQTNAFSFRVVCGVPKLFLPLIEESISFDESKIPLNEWVDLEIRFDLILKKAYSYINGDITQSVDLTDKQISAINEIEPSRSTLGTFHSALTGEERREFSGEISAFCAYEDFEKKRLLISYEFPESGRVRYRDLSANKNDLTFAGRDLIPLDDVLPIDEYDFSFAVLGDTQAINRKRGTTLYPKMFEWIRDKKDEKNIKLVMCVGDITNNNNREQWENAKNAYAILDKVVPYLNTLGSHDVTDRFGGELGLVHEYFKFEKDEFSDSFEGKIDNCYRKFTVNGIKYLILAFYYEFTEESFKWAKGVIENHPDYNVILNIHAYINEKGEYADWSKTEKIRDELVIAHNNVVFVVSGHFRGDDVRLKTHVREDGTTVQAMFTNPQDADSNCNCAVVTMLYFSKDGVNCEVRNYSTANRCYLGENSAFKFKIDLLESR